MAGNPPAFSVLVLTAPPPGQAAEAGGAHVKVDGREALLRSIELFLNRDEVKQIQIVFDKEAVEEAKKRHGAHLSFSGVKILTGGPRWIDQVAAAAGTIKGDCTHVILHDAARPVVPYTDLEALMAHAGEMKKPAAFLVAPLRASLVELDEGQAPVAVHRPERFAQVLTPQVFAKARFEQMAKAKEEVHASEAEVLKGSPLNVRVGGSGDASLAKAMTNLLPKAKKSPLANPFEEAQW